MPRIFVVVISNFNLSVVFTFYFIKFGTHQLHRTKINLFNP